MFGSRTECVAALYKRDLEGSCALEAAIRVAWERHRPALLDELLSDAPTSRSASDALHSIGAHHIGQGIDMPDGLRAWIAEHHGKVAERRPAGPALKKGRDPDGNLVRNAAIQYLVMQLRHLGLPATRNEASEGLTACQVVADEAGLGMATVHRIWVGRNSVPVLRKAYEIALHWHFRDLAAATQSIPIRFTRAG